VIERISKYAFVGFSHNRTTPSACLISYHIV